MITLYLQPQIYSRSASFRHFLSHNIIPQGMSEESIVESLMFIMIVLIYGVRRKKE